MEDIYNLLEDTITAAVLAQVSLYSGKISAKEIAKNVGIHVNTVYNHLNLLEKNKIVAADEIQVKNLTKKLWKRQPTSIEDEETRVKNTNFEKKFSGEPRSIVTYIRYLNGLIQENLVKLSQLDKKSFEEYQRTTNAPVWVKLYGLSSDDYEFALRKLNDLREQLYERSVARGEKEYRRTAFHSDENNFLFLITFPDLSKIE